MCKRNFRWDLKSNLCPPLVQCVEYEVFRRQGRISGGRQTKAKVFNVILSSRLINSCFKVNLLEWAEGGLRCILTWSKVSLAED